VEVRLGSKVTRVVRTLDGVDITAGGVTDHFDFVVITLDGPHTSLIHVS
jgi:predicted NAD/FAD-binding protein